MNKSNSNYDSPHVEIIVIEVEQSILNNSTNGGGGFGDLVDGEDLLN